MNAYKRSFMTGTMLGLSLLAWMPMTCPAAHAAENAQYVDGMLDGGSWDEIKAQCKALSALTNTAAVRVTPGDPIFHTDIYQQDQNRTTETGSSLNVRVGGRYLAVSGSISASFQQQVQESRADFSFTLRSSYDNGDFRITNPTLTASANALAKQGWNKFTSRYGTHCVTIQPDIVGNLFAFSARS